MQTGAARRPPCPPSTGACDQPERPSGAPTSRRGRNRRNASAGNAGAFAPRRPEIRPGSRRRPLERGGPRRRTRPRRDHARVSRSVGGRGVRRRRPAGRDRRARSTSTTTSDPEVLRRSSRAVPTPSSGAGLPTTPTRAAASSSRFSCTTRAFCTAISSSSSCLLERPRSTTRTSAFAPTASSARLDRRPSGRRTARIRRTPVVERPWLTGMWGERHAASTFADAVVRSDLRTTRGRR